VKADKRKNKLGIIFIICGPSGSGKTTLLSSLIKAKKIATMYGMMTMLDKYIGKILDKLEELGLEEDTVICFSTDHGHFYGHHNLCAKGPFHYDDGVRVPLIARCTGEIPANMESKALVSLIDLPVTFLSEANLPIPAAMQGVDQSPVFRGESASARDHLLVEFRHQPTAIHMKTFVEENYKLTLYYQQPYGELYDLRQDPCELHNLWDEPESLGLREDLTRKLLFAEMGAEPMPMQRISDA